MKGTVHSGVQQPSEAPRPACCAHSGHRCRPQSAEDPCAHVGVPGETQDKDGAGQRNPVLLPAACEPRACWPMHMWPIRNDQVQTRGLEKLQAPSPAAQPGVVSLCPHSRSPAQKAPRPLRTAQLPQTPSCSYRYACHWARQSRPSHPRCLAETGEWVGTEACRAAHGGLEPRLAALAPSHWPLPTLDLLPRKKQRDINVGLALPNTRVFSRDTVNTWKGVAQLWKTALTQLKQ